MLLGERVVKKFLADIEIVKILPGAVASGKPKPQLAGRTAGAFGRIQHGPYAGAQ